MRSLVRGLVVSAFGIGAVFGTAGLASAVHDDVDVCTGLSCNLTNVYTEFEFSDDDFQAQNFGVID